MSLDGNTCTLPSSSLPQHKSMVYQRCTKWGPLYAYCGSRWIAITPPWARTHQVLSPLAGKVSSHVRNSVDFMQRIHQTSLAETNIMLSFDAVSLFTNVPVDEALLVIGERSQQDTTLEEQTSIPIPNL